LRSVRVAIRRTDVAVSQRRYGATKSVSAIPILSMWRRADARADLFNCGLFPSLGVQRAYL
jgi:hypothetical protein